MKLFEPIGNYVCNLTESGYYTTISSEELTELREENKRLRKKNKKLKKTIKMLKDELKG